MCPPLSLSDKGAEEAGVVALVQGVVALHVATSAVETEGETSMDLAQKTKEVPVAVGQTTSRMRSHWC